MSQVDFPSTGFDVYQLVALGNETSPAPINRVQAGSLILPRAHQQEENIMKLKLIALLAILSLVVAACGETDDASADTQPTDTTAAVTETTEAMAEEEMVESNTIVDIAVADGRFNTLVTAVTEAGLVETLSGEGPFTVLAPTDDAFAALPEGLLDTVLADQELLTSILTYHVLDGAVPAATVVTLESAATLQGEEIAIAVDGDTVTINGATVIITDIEASNGIIHVIDAVLLPPTVAATLAG
jgi:uncharacterized surface protein with fasciclin (FAS1) repeats